MESLEKLIAYLKIAAHDLQVLHRHLTGDGWFTDHELIEEYYEEVSEMADDIIEIGIALGKREPGLIRSLELARPIDIQKRNSRLTFTMIKEMFHNIVNLIDQLKMDLPYADVVSKVEEYQYWLRKEADYKIAQRLFKND